MKDKTTIVLAVGIAAFVAAIASRFLLGGREGFMQQEIGAPADGSSGGMYNGIAAMMGAPQDLRSAPTPLKAYAAANDNEIFAFEDSTFKPECCPSSITSDSGCLCLSKQDEKSLAYRGGNRVA
jgi:hypothetical protein